MLFGEAVLRVRSVGLDGPTSIGDTVISNGPSMPFMRTDKAVLSVDYRKNSMLQEETKFHLLNLQRIRLI